MMNCSGVTQARIVVKQEPKNDNASNDNKVVDSRDVQERAAAFVHSLHDLCRRDPNATVAYPLPEDEQLAIAHLPILKRMFALCGLDIKYFMDISTANVPKHFLLLSLPSSVEKS
jgi:hypothetical protein